MRGWAAASLLLHGLIWAALMLGPGLVGRRIEAPPPEPAVVELVLGDGGQSVQPELGEEASPEPPAPAAPEPPPEDEAAPRLPDLPPPPRVSEAPPPPIVLPARPPASGGPASVRLADAGRPPHADLLDPENSRFRAAKGDSGNVMPGYPAEAARRLEAGTVRLQLFVAPSGQVANVLVVRSSGSVSLDAAAREQAATWRFAPARRDGRAVPDIVEIEIEFSLL